VPYCSHCGFEYIDTVTICTDCVRELKTCGSSAESSSPCSSCGTRCDNDDEFCWNCGSSLTQFDFDSNPPVSSHVVHKCENCGNYTSHEKDFCIECGYLRAGSRSCINHPDTMTHFACLVCQKVLCKKCCISKNGKYFCKEDAYYPFVGNWVVVKSDSHVEALGPAVQILDTYEIFTVVKDQMDTVQPYLAGQFALLVPITQLKSAEKVLIEKRILYENVCMHCNHEFNGNPNRCPHCGEEFVF